jgi:hypothetical protein
LGRASTSPGRFSEGPNRKGRSAASCPSVIGQTCGLGPSVQILVRPQVLYVLFAERPVTMMEGKSEQRRNDCDAVTAGSLLTISTSDWRLFYAYQTWDRSAVITEREVASIRNLPLPHAQRSITRGSTRFCCQHCSLCSVQNGFSFPWLTVLKRSAEIPSCTRALFTESALAIAAFTEPRAEASFVPPRP